MRAALAASLALLASCSEPRSPAPQAPPPGPSPAPSPRPSPAPTPSPTPAPSALAPFARTEAAEAACKAIGEASKKALARALSASEELKGDPVPDLSQIPRGCLDRTPWAIEIEAATPAPCKGSSCARLRWRPVFVAPSGEAARGPSETDLVGSRGLRLLAVEAHDWSGDGQPELLLRRARTALGCGREADASDERGDVWIFSNNQVTLYEPARRVGGATGPRGARDVDGDGRPDLLVEGPFRAVVELPCGVEGAAAALAGPELVAHALPGGAFSLDDEVARAALRRACPAAPSPVVLPSPKAAFVLGTAARNVACARAWGADPERLRSELDGARSQLCQSEGNCAALTELRRWASLDATARLP